MAEAKSKSKAQVVCTLCDKPITTGKPVIIDDDPYHTDCAKAMEQSSGAAEEAEEEDEDEAEEAEEDTDGEDEGDEDEEDEEEEEEPAPRTAKKVTAKAPAKRPVVADDDEDDEDDDDDDDDEDEEEEEVVVAKPAKKAAPVAKKTSRVVVEEDEDDEDEEEVDDEEEEEVVVPARKVKTTTKAAPVKATKRAAADYEEEDEPEERPRKAKAATNGRVKKAPAVDVSGWGNPATLGSKRYFVYQALKEVTKADLAVADGPGKPENVIARAKRLQRDWAKETKTTLSDKDKNFTSMNIGWIYNHADELKLVMRRNEEAGTYRIYKATNGDSD